MIHPGGGRGGARASLVAALCLASMLSVAACRSSPPGEGPTVRVASKAFTEGVILGELLAQLARDAGARVEHVEQLGGTQVVWNALVSGQIDAYPEYTGTLAQEVFAGRVSADAEALREALAELGLRLSAPIGFDNTFALGMAEERARELGVVTLSDLADHPELTVRLSTEFLERRDGWPGLRQTYGYRHPDVSGIEHALAYRALAEGAIDVTDLYRTDPEIAYYGFRVLHDDRSHFPDYRAVIVYRAELERRAPEVVGSFRRLEGRIDEPAMIALNAGVQMERREEAEVVAEFLRRELGVDDLSVGPDGLTARVRRRTLEHLGLVGLSLGVALLVALPLGIAAARHRRTGAVILAAVGVVQTIPSLALLVFMIPLLGIGALPAMAALFLYSLLPIVRNTATGLTSIPGGLLESADALGLPRRARLRLVELPIAAPTILAGIKTAAVINVGAATLGALIGAGGYGQPILTGIRLDDTALILEGAVPAALLALAVQAGFAALERFMVPRGLRL